MKTIRQILALCAFAACAIAVSCNPEDVKPEAPDPEITVTGATSNITFQAEPFPITFKVTGNYDWTVAVTEEAASWLTLSTASGVAGEEQTITATAEANGSEEGRTGKIVFTIAEPEYIREINVMQLGVEGPDYDTHSKGHVFYAEDFNWIKDVWPSKNANSKYGWSSVKSDGSNWNEFALGAAGAEEACAMFQDKGLGYDLEQKATYCRYEGYVKLGKTAWVGFVTIPSLANIDEGCLATIEVNWDAALYVATNLDHSAYAYQKITVMGEGTIVDCGTEGATISEDGKSVTVPIAYEGEYQWRWVRKSIIVENATAETSVRFGELENLDARSFIDNISVTRADDEGAEAAADELKDPDAFDYEIGTVGKDVYDAAGEKGFVTARINRTFKVESSAAWLQITNVICNTDAYGNTIAEDGLSAEVCGSGLQYKIHYDVVANSDSAEREATLTITSEGKTVETLTIKQAGYIAPAGVVTQIAKWSFTGIYSTFTLSGVDYTNPSGALAAISNDWVSGDHVIDSDVIAGGSFQLVSGNEAAYSVATGAQKKDRFRAKAEWTNNDYFVFKTGSISLAKGDIVRLKNAAVATTNVSSGPDKWAIEYSFDGQTWTQYGETAVLANKDALASMDVEVVADKAYADCNFYVRARVNMAEGDSARNNIAMLILANDASIVEDIHAYYKEDWAYVWFEVEKF